MERNEAPSSMQRIPMPETKANWFSREERGKTEGKAEGRQSGKEFLKRFFPTLSSLILPSAFPLASLCFDMGASARLQHMGSNLEFK
jgi:hypothetical protein